MIPYTMSPLGPNKYGLPWKWSPLNGMLADSSTPASVSFAWSMANATPETKGLAATTMGANAMEGYDPGGGVLISYSGGYLVVPATAFAHARWWYNSSNTSGFAWPTGGSLSFTFQYTASYAAGAMLMELGGKAYFGPPAGGADPTYDTNDGMSIVTALAGGTAPAIAFGSAGNNGASTITTPNLTINSPSSGVDYTIRAWWSSTLTRGLVVQIDNNPPAVWAAGSWPAWVAPIAHELISGNDTTNAMAYKLKNLTVRPDAPTYQMTAMFWQDFNFATLNTTNLAASDHHPSYTWTLSGTTARMSTNSDAFINMPKPVNNQTTTSTTGFKYDLAATAVEYAQCDNVSAGTSAGVIGLALKNLPTLASGNTQMFFFTADTTSNTRVVTELYLKNNSGSYELLMSNWSGTTRSGFSTALVLGASAPGKDIWVTAYLIRAGTCKIRAYDFTGGVLGSQYDAERTCTGSARNLDRIALGVNATSTAEAANTYFRMDNFCWEGPGQTTNGPIFPMLPSGT